MAKTEQYDPMVGQALDALKDAAKRMATRLIARGAEEIAESAESLLEEGKRRVRIVKANAQRIRAKARRELPDIDPYGFKR